ncbi:cyclophilin-like fold protein [Spirosoma flavum]|uniref:Cyclophilin-like fold protein n=1 Tax=Spirosoma flavum TaxID=2048557 RepID=A0ABW6AKY9_9BACT
MKLNQILLPLLLVVVGNLACKTDTPMAEDKPIKLDSTSLDNSPLTDRSSNRLRIRIGSNTFSATLLSNATVTAFKAKLPITLFMKELNRNEKFADLPSSLPTNAANPDTIQMGDLMLYGTNTLVLFYETVRTSYSYTKLGRIDNPTALAAALGSGNITVTLEMEL